MAAPRPQLVISDGGDWTKNVPDVEFPYIWNVYRLYGSQDKVENAHFADEKHDYGPSKRLAMYKFMARYLGLNLKAVVSENGAFDETDSTVAEESLKVFTPDHPRPEGTPTGSDAINALFEKAKTNS